MFKQVLLPKLNIVREDGTPRKYRIPSGEKYISVTSLLSQFYDKKDILEKWENRVGKKEAARLTAQAAIRGTRIHHIAERYLSNEDKPWEGQMPTAIHDFFNIKDVLDENITEVYGLELSLFSNRLKCAGTADLVCSWGNIPTIVDFKTSTKRKKEEWIENYFVQASIYGQMVNELYGLDVEQIVIIMLAEMSKPQIFIKKSSMYEERINEICFGLSSADGSGTNVRDGISPDSAAVC